MLRKLISAGKTVGLVAPLARRIGEERKYVVEIRSLQEWKDKILCASRPILLCCHASYVLLSWCPVSIPTVHHLTTAVHSSSGRWSLALLDIDHVTSLTEALGITTVPTLFLLKEGRTVQSR